MREFSAGAERKRKASIRTDQNAIPLLFRVLIQAPAVSYPGFPFRLRQRLFGLVW